MNILKAVDHGLRYMTYVQTAISLKETVRQKWAAWKYWTIEISEGDVSYFPVMRWIGDRPGGRHLVAVGRDRYEFKVRTTVLEFRSEPEKPTPIKLKTGHTIWVSNKAEPGMSRSDEDDDVLSSLASTVGKRKIFLTARSEEAFLALKEELMEVFYAAMARDNNPGVFLHDDYSWRKSPLQPRPLDSVVLHGNLMEDLHADLKRFLDDEERYTRTGSPYHRGYLFWGPPGTGKTSAIRALTTSLGLGLYYMSPDDQKNDTQLAARIANIPPRSVLLLEDVDTFAVAQDREEAVRSNVSLSALLNSLDGVTTPHGLIVFMTTNSRDAIDPALLRPGRVDMDVHIDLPDLDQVQRLFSLFYNEELGIVPCLGEPTAYYYEIFKRHMDNPEGARDALSPAGVGLELVA